MRRETFLIGNDCVQIQRVKTSGSFFCIVCRRCHGLGNGTGYIVFDIIKMREASLGPMIVAFQRVLQRCRTEGRNSLHILLAPGFRLFLLRFASRILYRDSTIRSFIGEGPHIKFGPIFDPIVGTVLPNP